ESEWFGVKVVLVLDALGDGVFALGELAQQDDASLDDADLLLVEVAGPFLAVARDERDGVALIEQLNHALDLQLANLEVLGDAREVEAVRLGSRLGRRQSGRHCIVPEIFVTCPGTWGSVACAVAPVGLI